MPIEVSNSQRGKWFCYLYATYLLCELLAPAIASATIAISIYVPFAIGLLFVMSCIPLILSMPDTLKIQSADDTVESNVQAPTPHSNEDLTPSSAAARSITQGPQGNSLFSLIYNWKFAIDLFALFITALIPASRSVLFQYAPLRAGMKTSTVATLISWTTAFEVVFALCVPARLSAFFISVRNFPPELADRNVAEISMLLLGLGEAFFAKTRSAKGIVTGEMSEVLSAKHTLTQIFQ